jgi:DNA-binding transcriptional LysR family regulator
MVRKMIWTDDAGHRVKLRDLHVFLNAARSGSMAQAARKLGVSQPTISEAIADLESTFGVKLLDRTSRGVEPTIFGNALMRRAVAAFDELKQGSLDIAFLSDSGHGELRIGFQESLSPALVAPLIQLFARRYPRVALQMDNLPSAELQFSELRARRYDFTLSLLAKPVLNERDLVAEILFHDHLAIAASATSVWAGRRKISLSELADSPWVLAPPDTLNFNQLAQAFKKIGLGMPKATIVTMSEPLRMLTLTNEDYVSAFTHSALRVSAQRYNIKALPIELPTQPWPIALMRLRNRTLTPAGERFIACAHEVGDAIARNKPIEV